MHWGGAKHKVTLWRLQPRGETQAELRPQAAALDHTVAELRKKLLGVAALTGDERLTECAAVVGGYQSCRGLVRPRSVVQVPEGSSG